MKWILIMLLAVSIGNFNDIAKVNRLKSEAQKAYQAGNYQAAIEKYSILIDSFQVTEQELLMNYANAAYLATRSSNSPTAGLEGPGNSGPEPTAEQANNLKQIAQQTYTSIAQTGSPELQSKAFNQLGVMAFHSTPSPKPGKEQLTQAQNLFKSALITDQNNQQARFNYELVTKMLDQQEQQDQQQQDQNQEQQQDQEQQDQEQQKDQQQQEQDQQEQQEQDQQEQQQSGEDQEQEGEQEKSEEQEGEPEESESSNPEEQEGEDQPQEQELNASPEKMEELKISEEKARMILEAMKNSEVQYIQQNQKKATKRPDSGKPDW